MMARCTRVVAPLLLLSLHLSEASPGLNWPLLRGAERGAERLANSNRGRPDCDGTVKCSKFISDSPEFFVDANATDVGCAFGHIADDGSCNIPCKGVGHEVCRCLSKKEAHGDNESLAGLSFAFGLVFTLVGCCACCCVGAEVLGQRKAARVVQAQDFEPGEHAIQSLTVSSDGLLQRGPSEFVKRGRALLALFLGLFFAIWFFFSTFLVAFGLWVLIFKKNAYYNGCF